MSKEGPASMFDHVQKHWDSLRDESPIYNFLLSDVAIVSAKHGRVLALLEVKEVHVNSKGGLHGAVSACLTDWAGGLAIASTGLVM